MAATLLSCLGSPATDCAALQQTFHCVPESCCYAANIADVQSQVAAVANCTIVEADCGKLSRTTTTTAADVTTTPAPSPAGTLRAGLFTAAIAAVVALASARF